MQNRSMIPIVLGLVALGCFLFVSGCSSSGGGGGNGAPVNGAINGPTSTIQGRVDEVVTALRSIDEQSTKFAQLLDFVTLVQTAHAQDTGGVMGITVTAEQGGNTVASTTTDVEGDFIVTVGAGSVRLLFETATFSASIEIIAPAESVVSIVVTLESNEVVLADLDIAQDPISCASGTINITKEPGSDFVIDGGGEACIVATGSCEVNIDPDDIVLTNCSRCIDVSDNATVALVTSGTLRCEALEDGLRVQDNGVVNLRAGEDIVIDAGESGIRTDNTAEVNLNATDDVIIEAVEDGIRAEGAAEVDVAALGCSIHGEDNALRTAGTATVTVPEACLLVSGLPTDDDDDDDVPVNDPIRCENDTLTLSSDPGTIFRIDGAGDACIRAEGNCELTIEAEHIELLNCEQCIRAAGNADVTLTATGDITCTATEDGIRASGTAQVLVDAQENLTIDVNENGVRASGTSDVTIASANCSIAGREDAIRTDGAASVNTAGCQDLNLEGDNDNDNDNDNDDS